MFMVVKAKETLKEKHEQESTKSGEHDDGNRDPFAIFRGFIDNLNSMTKHVEKPDAKHDASNEGETKLEPAVGQSHNSRDKPAEH
jgi:hypothetical protein